MPSANVNISEIDLSTRVPAFPGVFGAIVIPAVKGPVNEPVLVTSEAQLLSIFTPDERIEVGYDLAYFSALAYLQKSDKLWVVRAANDSLYAGAAIKRSDATTDNNALPGDYQLTDPDAYLFDSAPDIEGVAEVSTITTIAELSGPAVLQIEQYDFNGLTGADFDINGAGLYILTAAPDGSGPGVLWFNVTDGSFGQTTPSPGGGAVILANIPISVSDTADQIVQKIISTPDWIVIAAATGGFLSSAPTSPSSGVIQFQYDPSVASIIADGNAGTSGSTFSVVQEGAEASTGLDGKYFTIQDDVGSVAFWIDLDDSGTPAPAGALTADRNVEITTITAGMTAEQVAIALAAAIDLDSKFGATTISSGVVQVTDASTGERVPDLADVDTGFTMAVTTQGVTEVDLIDELMMIYASSQGDWGNKIGVKISTDPNTDGRITEPGAFIIDVFKVSNQANPIESFQVSRVEGQLDGFGRNIYVEEVLQASNFIRAVDNTAIDSAILPKDQSTILFFDAGDDGLAVADGDMILGADELSNPDDLFTTVLMDGGFATVAYGQHLTQVCESRQDSVAILSVPFGAEASSNYLNDIVDYRKNQLNVNSSYAALYTPHVRVFDKFNDRNLFVSPDGYAAGAISDSASNFEIWFPPAGFKRGILNVLDVKRRFSKGEMDVLYDNGINPIRFAPGKGIAIWGQKTLLSRPSALDRLNVRLMLISIEPAIAEALEDFLFDLNDEATRGLAVAIVSGALEGIQARRGITAFQVVSDSSNNTANDLDNNRMNIDIFVKPTPSLEFIRARVIITSQGIDFSLAAELV